MLMDEMLAWFLRVLASFLLLPLALLDREAEGAAEDEDVPENGQWGCQRDLKK